MKRWLPLVVSTGLCGLLLSLGVTQEVPIGTVQGKVVMGENGRPLEGALVTLTPAGTPDDEPMKPRFAETKADGTFEIRGVPADSYEVEVAAQYHELPKTITTVTEGAPTRVDLSLKRGEDRLNLYSSQRVFTPDERPKMELHGFIVQDAVQIDVRRVDIEEIAQKGGLQNTLSPLANAKVPNAADLKRAAPLLRHIDHKITKKDAEGAFIESLPVGDLGEGFYWVTVQAGKLKAHTVLSVSRIALITKNRGDQALMYATDLVSGKPLNGVAVSAQGTSGLVSLGRTGRDGLLQASLPSRAEGSATIVARQGKSVAIVGLWANTEANKEARIVGYTDRPVYRPGDTIKFKGIVRRIHDGGMRVPVGAGPVDVELRDPDNTVLATARAEMTPHGSFHGEFPTSAEAKPGYYRIYAKALGVELDSLGVTIASYRKPEYRVDVRPQGGPFVLGERASAVVDCQYYFGGPVVGAKVKASVYRTPLWTYEGEEGEMMEESYGAGDYSQEVEAVTDEAGRAVIQFQTKAEGDPDNFTTDFAYTVVASVADEAGKYFDGEGQVKVTRGEVDVRIETDRFVASPDEKVEAQVKVTDAEDRKRPIANQDVTLEVGEWRWTRRTSVEVPRATLQGRTNSEGIATFDVPFEKGGDFILRAKAKDSEGRDVVATNGVWVEGAAESGRPEADLRVRLDKRNYAGGDTARVLIETDTPGGSALLTVQAEGILEHRIVPLTSRATLVRLPVTYDYAPNVYVSAAYVREKQFREDTRRMVVGREDTNITVAVTPEKTDYRPGDLARLTVRTTDAAGKPAPAELSVGVVDESIYAIQEDTTNIRELLNPNRMDMIQTQHSFPEVYLDGGDKGSANIPLRKKFEDTAAWLPAVWTGPKGETTVEVKLPDNLTEWRTTAIGVTDGGASGQTTAKFRARKPLMVRMSPPAYLVQGDRQQVAFSVTNDTGADADVRVELGVEGLTADGDKNPRVRVAAGATEAVKLDLNAGDPGEAVLTAKAWIDASTNDGVEQRFQVVPHGRQKIDANAVEARPSAAMEFNLSGDAAPNAGALTVSVTPTLAGGAIQALDELVDFPYGCVEQTMSRFMPAVVVADTLQKLNLSRPTLSEKIPKVAADSMARLSRMQHGDGGWGWWEYDESDPFMTALVLDGLDRARRAGYAPTGINLESALTWATNRLAKPEKDELRRDRLYLAYAVLRHGRQVPELAKIDLAKATASEYAIAALAFHEANLTARRDEALRALEASATKSKTQTQWSASEFSWGEEPNALALTAFATIRPEDPIIPSIVRGIMARRKGKAWSSTRDTSYAVLGLVQVLANSRSGETAGEAIVRLNGREVRRIAIDPGKPEGETVTIPRSDLPTGDLKVEVERTGEGVAYASAELRQFVVEKEIPALSTDPELRVTRAYHVMEPRRLEDGTTKLLPSLRPVDQVRPGDLVRVELTIHSRNDREYVMIEDPTPSHCRVTEREDIAEGEEWGYWWSRNVIRDDRIAFFARWLKAGDNKVIYTMRAEGVGKASGLPTWVGNMYDPASYASTGETRLEVAP